MNLLMDTALQAAWEAGDVLLSKHAGPLTLTVKGERDVVTEADFAAQRIVLDWIRRTYPDHHILAEEGVGALNVDDDTPLWVVDPLDGTTNYTRHFPAFCVSIGLARRGQPYLGVIHDPVAGRTFLGETGLGAHLLEQSAPAPMRDLRASAITDMREAIIALDWAHDNAVRAETVQALARIAPRCRTLRAIGSAALALAWTAAGWIDGYYHPSLQPWDAAAGVAILRAAGGLALRPDGRDWQLGDSRLVAGAPAIVPQLLEIIRP